MFTRILTSALIAGASAGFLSALLQLWFVQPVLLQAELFESGTLSFSQGMAFPQVPFEFDLKRNGLSIVFNMLTFAGYGLVLVAVMSLAEDLGHVLSPRGGIAWGIAGFVAVYAAPWASLAPVVPGMETADVSARQLWWFATVASAAVAMWLIAFGKSWLAWSGAALFLLIPHVVGAPVAASVSNDVPPEIAALFAARTTAVGLAAWVILGLLSAALWLSGDEA